MARAHIYVHGKVQGVFFRSSAKGRARALGVKGWVKNCLDGSVEAIFEGEKSTVEEAVNWCKKGPAGAVVESIGVHWEDYLGEFHEFSVVY